MRQKKVCETLFLCERHISIFMANVIYEEQSRNIIKLSQKKPLYSRKWTRGGKICMYDKYNNTVMKFTKIIIIILLLQYNSREV